MKTYVLAKFIKFVILLMKPLQCLKMARFLKKYRFFLLKFGQRFRSVLLKGYVGTVDPWGMGVARGSKVVQFCFYRVFLLEMFTQCSDLYSPPDPPPQKKQGTPQTDRNSCVNFSNVIHYPPKSAGVIHSPLPHPRNPV